MTSIRNENAYYCCIAQLLPYLQRGVPAHPSSSEVPCPPLDGLLPCSYGSPPIYVCGDSHSLSPSWHTVEIRGKRRLLCPALVTGLKACTLVAFPSLPSKSRERC